MTVSSVLIASICLAFNLCGQAHQPNIVLVMADDQGWGQTGYNGHPTLKTPHLDAMAQAGMRFDEWLSVTKFFDLNPMLSRNGEFEEFEGDSSSVIVAEARTFRKPTDPTLKPSSNALSIRKAPVKSPNH